jgi:hydroxymethylpyrimidine/phosphomethylpyrimidine kinase
VARGTDQMLEQARRLRAAGAVRVLLKGGHDETSDRAVDVLAGPEGEHVLTARRIRTVNTHGTGCTLSSALTALRPQRGDWVETVTDAKAWLTEAIAAGDGLQIGAGAGPVHHFHQLWGR